MKPLTDPEVEVVQEVALEVAQVLDLVQEADLEVEVEVDLLQIRKILREMPKEELKVVLN